MPLLHRMNRLKELFRLRVGPGAATLPSNVTRIHLIFASRINNGHFGPRKFWQEYLPRLKYHNPGVSMTVEKVSDQTSAATMTVHFSSDSVAISPKEMQIAGEAGGPANTASGAQTTGRTETVDIRHKKEGEIYDRLLDVTKGQVIEPTDEEKAEVARLDQEAIEKAIDSKKKKEIMYKLKEEARLEKLMVQAAKASA